MSSPSRSFEAHDHGLCRARILSRLDEICAARRLRLTPMRRRVMEILLESHTAIGAYDVLQRLNAQGHAAQPPVAYRALDFLVEHGFVHRIERLSAFIACADPGSCHAPAFLICRSCRCVAESQAAPHKGALGRDARALGFEIEDTLVEAEGTCPSCREGAAP